MFERDSVVEKTTNYMWTDRDGKVWYVDGNGMFWGLPWLEEEGRMMTVDEMISWLAQFPNDAREHESNGV